jgi:hypothetical protein
MQKKKVDQTGTVLKQDTMNISMRFWRTKKSRVIQNICYKPDNSCGKIEVTMVTLSANKKGRFINILKQFHIHEN